MHILRNTNCPPVRRSSLEFKEKNRFTWVSFDKGRGDVRSMAQSGPAMHYISFSLETFITDPSADVVVWGKVSSKICSRMHSVALACAWLHSVGMSSI